MCLNNDFIWMLVMSNTAQWQVLHYCLVSVYTRSSRYLLAVLTAGKNTPFNKHWKKTQELDDAWYHSYINSCMYTKETKFLFYWEGKTNQMYALLLLLISRATVIVCDDSHYLSLSSSGKHFTNIACFV